MTPYLLLLIAIAALMTFFTRAAPFLFFRNGMPPALEKAASRMPPAIMAVLVVYCLKGDLFTASGWPALVGVAATVALHIWRRSTLLSIAGGTIVYMALIRLFV